MRTTRRIVRNQESSKGGTKERGEGAEGRRAERSRLLYYRQGVGDDGNDVPYYEPIVWDTMINAELRVERRWMEGLVRSLRDYGTWRDGPPKIDSTDYVLDDFKPPLNAAILSLRPPAWPRQVYLLAPIFSSLFFVLFALIFIFRRSLFLFSNGCFFFFFFREKRIPPREDSGSGSL